MTRVVLVGSLRPFSGAVLDGLCARGVNPAAVVIDGFAPAPDVSPIPISSPAASLPDVARARSLSVEGTGDRPLADVLREARPDVVFAACYPRRIDDDAVAASGAGGFNVHPAVLPAYRGPSPVFWQLRDGCARGGVTVHRVTGEMDAGPIVAQAETEIPAGASESGLASALGTRGGALCADVIEALANGSLAERAQSEAEATRQGLPDRSAYRLSTTWDADRAYRFMRGVEARGETFEIECGDAVLRVKRVLANDEPANESEAVATLVFAGGALRVVSAETS